MRILGVDPGLTRLGVGVIDNPRGREVLMVDVTVLTTPTDWEVSHRLKTLHDGVLKLLTTHQPERVVIERVFAQHNVRTVMGTAQVSGVVMALAASLGIPVSHRTPSEVKAAVTGYGNAKKPQVQKMVQTILGLAEIPKPADAADALALAITEAWRGQAAATPENALETPAQRAWREAAANASRPRLKR